MPNYGFAIDSGMHRLSRVHDSLQGGARDPDRRQPMLGENSRKKAPSPIRAGFLPCPLQSVRRGAVRAHLPDQRPLQAPRRHRRSNSDGCIGCRACMEACPYDQLFIYPNTHTAEKCNFCANRVENELLPACVSVCPTECRIFGDLDDPASEVAHIVQHEAFTCESRRREPPEGLLYRGRGQRDPARSRDAAARLQGRAGHHAAAWRARTDPLRPASHASTTTCPTAAAGIRHGDYLLTKGQSRRRDADVGAHAGCWGSDAARGRDRAGDQTFRRGCGGRPRRRSRERQRFYYIRVRPNWRSWMVRGAYFLTAHGALTMFWLIAGWMVRARHLFCSSSRPWSSRCSPRHTPASCCAGTRAHCGRDRTRRSISFAQAIAEGSAATLIVARFAGGAGAAERPLACALASRWPCT